ncbi:flagellar biosynthesis, cell-distal portion of basal-body rod [Vibrio sp. EJY3]|uniref:flagellar biosynthesis, cell-distal portion of basal-body rod n=1 Tax=Vibrio sp. (strain EJY3) TaxID=1116375 RepID=UPI000243B1DD|nr:flagellar biosynthesis, cell-distal portion of basal-body rod [Vibrio sp. EJY3]AEX22420.1 flagellar biosynthesis, cell-distal portion of basal-body rod [Vibrio sp. EJY3]
MSDFPDLLSAFGEAVDALKVKLSTDSGTRTTYNGEEIKSIAADIDAQYAEIKGTLNALTENQQSGVVIFQTYALLTDHTPTSEQETGSFKVVNDPDSSLNGYYTWVSETTYTKDADLVTNEVNEANTSDAVSGSAVVNYTASIRASILALKEEQLQRLGVDIDIDLAAGSAPSAGYWAFNEVASGDGSLEGLEVYVSGAGTINIRVYSDTDGLFTKVSEVIGVAVLDGLNTLTPSDFGDISIAEGQYIAVQSGTATLQYSSDTYYSGGLLNLGINDSITNTIPVNEIYIQAKFTLSNIVQSVTSDALSSLKNSVNEFSGEAGSISLSSNLDKILIVSNSYNQTSGLKGKSPTAVASSLSDYNFANMSTNGATMNRNSQWVREDTAVRGDTFSMYNPSHAIIVENQNTKTTQTDDEYIESTQELIDVLLSRGVIPIIVSEWAASTQAGVMVDGEVRNVRALKALAEKNGLLFVDGTTKQWLLTPTTYDDFWYSAHPKTRTQFMIADAFRNVTKQLPSPRQTMKIFRARNSPSSISELIYSTTGERHRLFKELMTSHEAIADIDAAMFDTDGGNGASLQVVYDEYVRLEQSEVIDSMTEYSLIESTLPVVTNSVSLTINDTSATVYVRVKSDSDVWWEECFLVNGVFKTPNIVGVVDYDKVAFLLYKSGGVDLTESPVISWTDGVTKSARKSYTMIATVGEEMLTQPFVVDAGSVASSWINNGSLQVVIPDDGQLPTDCSGCVEVTSVAAISQAFSYTQLEDSVDVTIRVWARLWKAQHPSTSNFSESEINYETPDTGTIVVRLSGTSSPLAASSIMTDEVGLHWCELEFLGCLSGLTTSAMVTVQSDNDDIQIAKVSVKRRN